MKANRFNTLKETKSRFLSLSLPVEKTMGKVHSVFTTSFNVEVNAQLINFSRIGMSLSAHGCLLKKESMDQLLNVCRPGDLVRVDKGIFTFYTSQEIIRVDCSKMEEIDLSIPNLEVSIRGITQTPSYSVLRSLPYKEEMGLEDEGLTHEAFDVLRNVNESEKEDIERTIDHLIGRGKGLTPSGDDILVGFTMIRKAFLAAEAFESLLSQRLEKRHTTDISLAYFKALFSGFVSSQFVTLIESLEKEDFQEVEEHIKRIGKYGHTSGYDTLFGFYLGLQSLIDEREEL